MLRLLVAVIALPMLTLDSRGAENRIPLCPNPWTTLFVRRTETFTFVFSRNRAGICTRSR